MNRKATIATTLFLAACMVSGLATARSLLPKTSSEHTSTEATPDGKLLTITKVIDCLGSTFCSAEIKGRANSVVTLDQMSCYSDINGGTAELAGVTRGGFQLVAIAPVLSRSVEGAREQAVSQAQIQVSLKANDVVSVGFQASDGAVVSYLACVLTGVVRKLK